MFDYTKQVPLHIMNTFNVAGIFASTNNNLHFNNLNATQ